MTLLVLSTLLYGQETGQETAGQERNSGALFFALGENILRNTLGFCMFIVVDAKLYIAGENIA